MVVLIVYISAKSDIYKYEMFLHTHTRVKIKFP